MNHTKNSFFLVLVSEYCRVQESSRGLESVEDTVCKIRVLVGALGQGWLRKLADNGKLAAHQEDAIIYELAKLDRLFDGIEYVWFLEWSECWPRATPKSHRASHRSGLSWMRIEPRVVTGQSQKFESLV